MCDELVGNWAEVNILEGTEVKLDGSKHTERKRKWNWAEVNRKLSGSKQTPSGSPLTQSQVRPWDTIWGLTHTFYCRHFGCLWPLYTTNGAPAAPQPEDQQSNGVGPQPDEAAAEGPTTPLSPSSVHVLSVGDAGFDQAMINGKVGNFKNGAHSNLILEMLFIINIIITIMLVSTGEVSAAQIADIAHIPRNPGA